MRGMDRLTEREWLISLLTIEQEQMLTDYEVHPDAWKGDPERTDCIAALADGILDGLAHRRASQAAPAPFQTRVAPWMQTCFGAEVSADKLERGDRLLEEVLELLQSGNYPSERVAMLTSYVWSRDIGEPAQEVGGVMVTLAAYCLAHGLDMHDAGETELARIWTKVEKIRAKQAAKPKGSALPQVWAAPAPSDGLREENARLRAAVEFYANPDNWIDTPDWDGPDTATPKAVPVMNDPHGSRPCDCGDTARAALSTPTEGEA